MDDLRQWTADRREVLVREHSIGEARLRELEQETVLLQRSLLRVSGGIAALDEVLAALEPAPSADVPGSGVLQVG